MSIWSLADLHLSFGVPNKKMDIFGDDWKDHAEKIEKEWHACVAPSDLVLIPGDISWAMRPEEAQADLDWIEALPGTKLLIRGNHDYWWSSRSKVMKILPPSLHIIQNDAFYWHGVAIAGARLWDTQEYSFGSFFPPSEKGALQKKDDTADSERIFQREIKRLEESLKQMNSKATLRIAMTHYPPIGNDLHPSQISRLLERYHVDICVFGHLHGIDRNNKLFTKKAPISYHLCSCDYLNFVPKKIVP